MKQTRIFLADSIDPAPQYERLRFDGIRFYRCTFPKGAHQTYYYPEAVPYAKLASCHIQVSGRMVEPSGTWPDQGPGWMSREEPFVIPAGTFTRLAAEDSVRWCCTGRFNGDRTDYVTPQRVHGIVVLEAGDSLLLAEGAVQAADQTITRGTRLQATRRTPLLVHDEPCYVFRWRTPDAQS